VSITASLADQPIAGVNASVSMITKGGQYWLGRRTVELAPPAADIRRIVKAHKIVVFLTVEGGHTRSTTICGCFGCITSWGYGR
jgi:hypothetical protein